MIKWGKHGKECEEIKMTEEKTTTRRKGLKKREKRRLWRKGKKRDQISIGIKQ